MHLIGAHCIDNGGIHMAVRRAGRGNMRAMQLFTAIPKYYNDKVSIKAERVERFRDALAKTDIDPANIVVHAAYVLNCATPEEDKWSRAAGGLAKEFERSSTLGVGGVCFHPGAATDGDRDRGIARVAEAMSKALDAVPSGRTRLLIENTAGAGTTVGKTPQEVAAMLASLSPAQRKRAGYGLDTCHLFSSGFDLSASRDELTRILDAFEEATGEPPSFFHLNDSEGALGSNRDRHMLVGEGKIGPDAFAWLMQDRRSQGIPLILETPQANPNVGEDDDTPDPWDLSSMEKLLAMAQ